MTFLGEVFVHKTIFTIAPISSMLNSIMSYGHKNLLSVTFLPLGTFSYSTHQPLYKENNL